MIGLWWRLCRGYRLRPWRSPYLLWRIETYWGLHASEIGFADFWRFVWQRRADLLRYARWREEMLTPDRADRRVSTDPLHPPNPASIAER